MTDTGPKSPSEYEGGWRWCWLHLPVELRWILVFLVPVTVGVLVGRALPCTSIGPQVTGTLFEASGLYIVWQGLDEIARKQGLPTTGQRLYGWVYAWVVIDAAPVGSRRRRIRDWWQERLVGKEVVIRVAAGSGMVGITGETTGYGVENFVAQTVPEQIEELRRRVLEVEHLAKQTKLKLASSRSEFKKDVEAVERRLLDQIAVLEGRVKTLTGEGIHIEAGGLLLVLLGALCATFADKLAMYWPFVL